MWAQFFNQLKLSEIVYNFSLSFSLSVFFFNDWLNESFFYHACLKALHYYFIARSEAFYQGMTKSPVSRPLIILNFFNMYVTFVWKLWTPSCQNYEARCNFFFRYYLVFFWKYVYVSRIENHSWLCAWDVERFFRHTSCLSLTHIHYFICNNLFLLVDLRLGYHDESSRASYWCLAHVCYI